MNERGSGDVHQISMELGSLKQSVENLMRMWHDQEAAAIRGRNSLHEKFERVRNEVVALSNDVIGLSGRVHGIGETLKVVEPAVKAFNEEKLRAEGAKRLGVRLWAAMMAAAAAIGWGLHELLGWIRHP